MRERLNPNHRLAGFIESICAYGDVPRWNFAQPVALRRRKVSKAEIYEDLAVPLGVAYGTSQKAVIRESVRVHLTSGIYHGLVGDPRQPFGICVVYLSSTLTQVSRRLECARYCQKDAAPFTIPSTVACASNHCHPRDYYPKARDPVH